MQSHSKVLRSAGFLGIGISVCFAVACSSAAAPAPTFLDNEKDASPRTYGSDASGGNNDAGMAVRDSGKCKPGEKQCGDACVSVSDPKFGCDSNSCGQCGSAHATASCGGGKCVIESCQNEWADCDKNPNNGCETDLNSPTSCGSCGTKCSAGKNQFAKCVSDQCVTTCGLQYWDCDGDTSNGCEVNGATDPYNCGACGNICDNTCAFGFCQ
jgi:hypothetical protein